MMTGGCHCGLIRYEVSALPFDSDYCHCTDCRRTTGAPFGVWMDFKSEQVKWLSGEPKEYASSEKSRRGFCPNCGTSLSYRHLEHPEYFTLSTASLDEPDAVAPKYHIFTNQAVSWLDIKDTLPRYVRGRNGA